VTMSDEATLSNETSRSRQTRDQLGIPDFFGLQNVLVDALPNAKDGTPVDPSQLVKMDSRTGNDGRGSVARSETMRMDVAAIITQVLPNGNFVIQGRQEIRVNFELRGRGGRDRAAGGHHARQHHQPRQDRGAAGRLRRPGPDHGRAAAALRRAGAG
jgi:hypothetical protein